MIRRGITGGVLAAAVGLAGVGCDTDPPPVIEAKKIEEPQIAVPELKPPIKPAQSDEAAAQLLKEAIAAHTGGHPERLDKLRNCSFTRTGVVTMPSGAFPAVWKMDVLWPDRYRMTAEIQAGASITRTVFTRSPAGAWQFPPDNPQGKQALDKESARTFLAQFHEDAVGLLFPLADRATVVTRATDETVNGKELVGLHVWTPALDYALVSIDKKTKLLTRVVYNGREDRFNVVKELVATEHQEFDGVKLASKLYVKGNGRNLADWTKLSVTTDKPVDPKVFDGP
jgi:hypothetical protein